MDFPEAKLPVEVVETGLDGTVAVKAKVDVATGRVLEIISVGGPDNVCDGTTRSEVLMLREAVRQHAMTVRAKVPKVDKNARTVELFLDFLVKKNGQANGGTNSAIMKAPATGTDQIPKMIDKGTLNFSSISMPAPIYPPAALTIKAEGEVKIRTVIDEDGTVYSATPYSGHPFLRIPAKNAACQAKFNQTLLSGQPVKVAGFLIYNFVLEHEMERRQSR